MQKILKLSHFIIDFILIIISFILAYFLRVWFLLSTDFPFNNYAKVFLIISIIWMAILLIQKNYNSEPKSKRITFFNIITSNLIAVTTFVLVFFYNRDVFFSRLLLVYVWGISNILIISNAWIFRIIKFKIYKKGIWTVKTLIIGANKTAENLIKNLQTNEPYYEAIAILDAYGTKKKEILNVPVLWKMNSIEEIILEKNIKVIMQADCIEQSLNIIQLSEKNHLKYFLAPSLLGMYKQNTKGVNIWEQVMIESN